MNEEEAKEQSVNRFLHLIEKSRRGNLKIYVGMSAGVGKTYRMLEEAHRLLQKGVHVQVGLVETHGRKETQALLAGLPLIPRKAVFYKGKQLEEMDLPAILNARPEVVLVDELAHTNIPGSRNEKRWQDVTDILQAGISVISAVNIQHLESLVGKVETITGVEIKERVPDQILRMADEIVNIDLTANELIARLDEGKIYEPAKVEMAKKGFFQPDHLLQLRELALWEVAHQVERKIHSEVVKPNRLRADRFLACISSNPEGARRIIRWTARLASSYGDARWYVLYVQTSREDSSRIALAAQRHLINNFKTATELGAEVVKINSDQVATAIVEFARQKEISLLVIGKPHFHWWNFVFRSSLLRKLLIKTETTPINIIIIS